MATTTPNFGWSVPTSTDLVKDGATAIETLGDSIDASLLDLKGGTSGQVLAKNSNTDMDFVWVTTDDTNAIQNAIVDAKGDLIGATAADTPARLAVGTNGQVLTADSTAATGLAWATSASGGLTSLASGSLPTGSGTLTLSSISASYKKLFLVLDNVYPATDAQVPRFEFNSDTGSNYVGSKIASTSTTLANATEAAIFNSNGGTAWSNNAASKNAILLYLDNYASTTAYKKVQCRTHYRDTAAAQVSVLYQGTWLGTGAISTIDVKLASGNFGAGTYILYGVN